MRIEDNDKVYLDWWSRTNTEKFEQYLLGFAYEIEYKARAIEYKYLSQ